MVTGNWCSGMINFWVVRGVKGRRLLGNHDKGYDKWLGEGNWEKMQAGTGVEGDLFFFWDGFKLQSVDR